MPVFYEAALRSEALHALQHTTLLLAAALFWWALLYGCHGRMAYGMSVGYLFTTAIHTGLLGALLTFAGRAWYPTYKERGASMGAYRARGSADRGLVMWVPGGILFTLAGLGLFAAWLREAERRVERGVSAPWPTRG
jgi:putative membrane protein